MEGDQCCSVCKQAPHGLAATREQVNRMIQRGIQEKWRKYIELTAHHLLTRRWWLGPISFVHGVEIAIQVVLKIEYAVTKQWVNGAFHETLAALKLAEPSKFGLAQAHDTLSYARATLECLMETKGEFTCAQLYSKNRMQVSKELRRFIEFDTKKEKFDMGNVRAADYDLYKDAAAASKETLRALLVTKKTLVLDKKRDRNGEESATVVNARRAE